MSHQEIIPGVTTDRSCPVKIDFNQKEGSMIVNGVVIPSTATSVSVVNKTVLIDEPQTPIKPGSSNIDISNSTGSIYYGGDLCSEEEEELMKKYKSKVDQ
jgi:hypothetical protein